MRSLFALLALAVAPAALAQALIAPSYYLTTAPEVELGGTVAGELTAASGQNFKDGSRVAVTVLRPEPGVPTAIEVRSDAFDAYLTLYAPDGTLIDAVDDGPTGLDPRLVFTPDASGAHLLVVSGFGPYDVGPFTVSAEVAEVPEAEPLPLPGTLESELTGTEAPDPEVGQGATRSFTMELEEASLVRVRVASDAFDTVLAVFDEVGWLDQNDDAGGTTDSELLLELAPGRYRVAVAAWGDGSGPFTIRTDRYLPAD